MFDTTPANGQNRLVSGLLSVGLQVGLILVLLYGLAPPNMRVAVQSALTSLNLRMPPPPAPPPPAAQHAARRTAKAAPPARRAQAAPVVAPRVVPLKPPPVIPVAPIVSQGAATHAGAAAARIGSGAGGQENGTGAGGMGDGDGDGDGPELVSGRIKPSDTPANLFHAPFSGTTSALVQIDATGKITDCRTQTSSGNATLDTLTCHLVATRFHFRPARDPTGRAVPGKIIYDHDWDIGGAFEPN